MSTLQNLKPQPQPVPYRVLSQKIDMVDGKPIRTSTLETKQPVSREMIEKEIADLTSHIEALQNEKSDKEAQLELIK